MLVDKITKIQCPNCGWRLKLVDVGKGYQATTWEYNCSGCGRNFYAQPPKPLVKCAGCDQKMKEEFTRQHKGRFWCGNCVSYAANWCNKCDVPTLNWIEKYGVIWCQSCLNPRFACVDCGQEFNKDSIIRVGSMVWCRGCL